MWDNDPRSTLNARYEAVDPQPRYMTPSTALVIEYTSVAGNILFTYLIGRELRVGWLFGFVASVLGIILYGGEAAWLMAALNGFYAAMGVYGWWSWGRVVEEYRITTLSWAQHGAVVAIGIGCTLGLVVLMRTVGLSGGFVRMEAFIAAFALVATWLMSKKVLENWIYWTVGDLVAVYYNHQLGLHGYTLLMIVYIVLAVVGFINWRKQFTLQV